MAGGEWNTTRERKQLAADARELEREQVRLAKRMLRDLRWSAERSRLKESDWTDLLTLHHQYGKEGPSQLWLELIPFWSQSQRLNGGVPCPDRSSLIGSLKLKPKLTAKNRRTLRLPDQKTPPAKPPVLRENHVRTPAKPAPATNPAHLKHLANHD
jgi:hypothetical protein